MTSTTLFNKNFMPIFRHEMKKMIISLITFPVLSIVYTLAVGYSVAQSSYYSTDTLQPEVNTIRDITASVANAQLMGIVSLLAIASAFFAVLLYRSLYSRRQTDFFGALPVTRQTEYLAKTLSVALVILSTYVTAGIGLLLLKVVIPAKFHVSVEVGYCLRAMVVSLAASFAFYCIAQLCAVTAGKLWQYWTLLIGIGICFPSGIMVYLSAIPTFLPGTPKSAVNFGALCTPLFMVPLSTEHTFRFRVLILCGIFIAAAAYLLGAYLFSKRSNECAEHTVSSQVVSTLAVCGAALCVVDIPGILPLKRNMYLLYAAIAVLAMAAVSVICTLIYHRKVLTKATGIQLCVLSVVVFGTIALLGSDAFGYRDAVPDLQEVESVSVTPDYYDHAAVDLDYFDYSISYYNEMDTIDPYLFTDTESVSDMLALQKKCIQEELSSYTNTSGTSVKFSFKLKDGSVITRVYTMPDNNYMSSVYATKGYKMQQPFIDGVTQQDVLYIYFNQAADEDANYVEDEDVRLCLLDPKTYYPAIVSDFMALNETEMAIINDYDSGNNSISFDLLIIKPGTDAATRAKLEKMSCTELNTLYSKYEGKNDEKSPIIRESVMLPVKTVNSHQTMDLLSKDGLVADALQQAPAFKDVQLMMIAPIQYVEYWNEIQLGEMESNYISDSHADNLLGVPIVLKGYEDFYTDIFQIVRPADAQTQSDIEKTLAQVQDDADQAQLFEKNGKSGYVVIFKTKKGAYSKTYFVKEAYGYQAVSIEEE